MRFVNISIKEKHFKVLKNKFVLHALNIRALFPLLRPFSKFRLKEGEVMIGTQVAK